MPQGRITWIKQPCATRRASSRAIWVGDAVRGRESMRRCKDEAPQRSRQHCTHVRPLRKHKMTLVSDFKRSSVQPGESWCDLPMHTKHHTPAACRTVCSTDFCDMAKVHGMTGRARCGGSLMLRSARCSAASMLRASASALWRRCSAAYASAGLETAGRRDSNTDTDLRRC